MDVCRPNEPCWPYENDYVYLYDAYDHDPPPVVAVPEEVYFDEEPFDINIEDTYYDDDYDSYEEVEDEAWLPYTPPAPAVAAPTGQAGPQQQVVLAAGIPGFGAFPAGVEMTDSYCALHVAECAARKPSAVNATCGAADGNCTMAGLEDGKGMVKELRKIDLSGMGMVLLIVPLLLVGVHFGWNSEKQPGSPGKSDEADDASVCFRRVRADPRRNKRVREPWVGW